MRFLCFRDLQLLLKNWKIWGLKFQIAIVWAESRLLPSDRKHTLEFSTILTTPCSVTVQLFHLFMLPACLLQSFEFVTYGKDFYASTLSILTHFSLIEPLNFS